MTSPHQDAADLVAELRRHAEYVMSNFPDDVCSRAANLIEQQAKALGDVQADADCQRYMANKNYDLWHKERDRTDALEARLAEAMRVIEPFAAQAECWPELQDNQAIMTSNGDDLSSLDMLMSDLRAARSFLTSASNKEPR